ncbi:hypothetical protein P170DRAFT_433414 [Aspergillus steynii IBT 23096]|uniref:BZIP domain-containing protein n=1 Tax=Aspergillus steynii IBT 23096 TaxID=1392250 RepID=A0A2I2GET8_9EURO|nr:uncharacterized protein P170DRAFT_433414 [Aspergillus steynii IBT 23096]PLB51404.1 hypothetical protein P170DRAFT_433414 [Aspergillus steynii IBT 23096]
MADITVMGGSLPQSPELWADFMYSDYPYHAATACGLSPLTSSPHDALTDQRPDDPLAVGLDPLLVPVTSLPDLDLSAGGLIPSMMAPMLPPEINDSHSSFSQSAAFPSSKARRRGWLSPGAEESGGDDRSLSPAGEEGRLQERRRRNKLASRRLRQKHLDHVADLESRLEAMTQERDGLRLRVAKWEGEAMALRKLLENRTNG